MMFQPAKTTTCDMPPALFRAQYNGRFHGFPPKDAHGILEAQLSALKQQEEKPLEEYGCFQK